MISKENLIKNLKLNQSVFIIPFYKTKLNMNSNKKSFSKKSLKILSIGRLTKQKDHMTLLKAAKLINPAKT